MRIDNPPNGLVPRLQGLHLFHFDGAPCAQRVRFALAEKGLSRGREVAYDADDPHANGCDAGTWTSRHVSLVRKEHFTPFYAGIQPNLVVPALVHDGELHIESMDIIRYLDDCFGGEPLLPREGDAARQETVALTEEGERLHRSIRFVTFRWGLGRLGRLNAAEEANLHALLKQAPDAEQLIDFYGDYDADAIPLRVYEHHLLALHAAFSRLDARLADGRAFLAGDAITMADVLWAMKTLRLDECGYPFATTHPNWWRWFQRVQQRPAFRSGVMERHRRMNTLFRAKSRLESLFGRGLRRGLHDALAAV
ncbi:MAG: glutathione S-transferase family protein [Pseudomonadales bacterium]